MGIIKSLLFLICVALWFFAGCAKQQQFNAIEQICVPKSNKQQALQIAKEVLGKMHFAIAKFDTEKEYIRSKPLAGAQFFEFWRSDNVGAFNWLESNLHSIRRIVELDTSKTPNQKNSQICINCNVNIQRLSIYGQQASSIAQTFQSSKFKIQNLKPVWVDLGRDTRLETEILKRVSSMLDAQHSRRDTKHQESSIENQE